MNKIDICIRESSTGSYSPWHLDVAKDYNEPLLCTSDMAWFVKVDKDIYQIENHNVDKLYNELIRIEGENDSGEISDDDTTKLAHKLVEQYTIRKCMPLEEFKELLEKRKKGK